MNRTKIFLRKYSKNDGLHPLQKAGLLGLFLMVGISASIGKTGDVLQRYADHIMSAVLPGTIVELTNMEREREGLGELSRCSVLDEAARMKAEHMKEYEYFSHFSPGDGISPWHWFRTAGYDYIHAGENLAIYFNNSKDVVKAWMESPLHRENILKERYSEIGVAAVEGVYKGYQTVYVVQLFGTPAPTLEFTEPEPISYAEPEPIEPDAEKDIEGSEDLILEEEGRQIPFEIPEETEDDEMQERDDPTHIDTIPAGEGFAFISGHLATTTPLLPAIMGDTYLQGDILQANNEPTGSQRGIMITYLITALLVGLSFFSSIIMSLAGQVYIQSFYGLFLFSIFIFAVYTHFLYVAT